jgi:RNA polymerase sigma-70 factor (ECF subfamily)
VAVHRLRQRYGELLRNEVAQTVSTPAEVNEELRYLVAVIRDGLENSGNVSLEKL